MMILEVVQGAGCNLTENITLEPKIVNLVANIITLIKIVIPVLLIIWGMLDLGKAVIAQKEDEIKAGQKTFIKRLIAAIIVFFIPTIVKLLLSVIGEDATTCWQAFFGG